MVSTGADVNAISGSSMNSQLYHTFTHGLPIA